MQAPPQGWPDDDVFTPPGFEFGETTGPGAGFPRPAPPRPGRPRTVPGRPGARAEWAGLLRSLLPQPAERRWSREFVNGLEFRGWGSEWRSRSWPWWSSASPSW